MTEPDPLTGEPEELVPDTTALAPTAIRAAGWSAVQAWGSRLLSVVVFAVLAHLLQPREFGLVSLAAAMLALFLMLQDQGLGPALVQRRTLDDRMLSTAFWASVVFGLGLFAVTVATAGVVAQVLGQPRLAPVLRWMAGGFVLAGIDTTQVALLRRELRFRGLAIRELGATVLGGTVAIVVATEGGSVWALVAQSLVGGAVAMALLWRSSNWRPRRHFSFAELRDLLPFAAYTSGLGIFSFLSQRGDDLLIGAVLGSVALGYYSVAYRVLLLTADLFINVVNAVALPVFAKVQEDVTRVRRVLDMALRVLSAIAIPAYGFIATFADDIVRIAFGPGWNRSVPVLRVLCLAGIFQSVNFVLQWMLLALGKKRESLMLNGVNAVFNVVGFALAVHWGITAVALSFVVRAYLLSPWTIRATRDAAGVGWRQVLGPVIPATRAAAVAVFAMVAWKLGTADIPTALRLAGGCIIGGVVYLGALRVSAVEEWKLLSGFLRTVRLQGGRG